MLEESVVYQDILQKGAERGFRRLRNLVMGQLDQLLGKLSAKTRKQVEELSIEQLEELGKALLKFKSEKDLTAWLKQRAATH